MYAGEFKSPRQYLFDQASRLPNVYLSYLEYLRMTKPVEKTAMKRNLEIEMEDVLEEVRSWEVGWRLVAQPAVEECVLSQDDQERYDLATKLVFDDKRNAGFTFLLYNTTLILVVELWKALRKVQGTGSTPSSNNLEEDNCSKTNESLASQSHKADMDICRTLSDYEKPSDSREYSIQL